MSGQRSLHSSQFALAGAAAKHNASRKSQRIGFVIGASAALTYWAIRQAPSRRPLSVTVIAPSAELNLMNPL